MATRKRTGLLKLPQRPRTPVRNTRALIPSPRPKGCPDYAPLSYYRQPKWVRLDPAVRARMERDHNPDYRTPRQSLIQKMAQKGTGWWNVLTRSNPNAPHLAPLPGNLAPEQAIQQVRKRYPQLAGTLKLRLIPQTGPEAWYVKRNGKRLGTVRSDTLRNVIDIARILYGKGLILTPVDGHEAAPEGWR